MFNGMQWPMVQAQPDVSGSTIVHSSGSNAMVWQGDSGPYYRGGATCQVEGCTADLFLEEKPYCVKKRICSEHMRAECIAKPGDTTQLWRFCFQCGKLEPLCEFDGPKRSCRARLQRRKLPPRRSMSWAPGCVPRSTVSSSGSSSEHFFQYQQPPQQQQDQALPQRLQELQRQQGQLAAAAMFSTPTMSVASAGVPASVASNPEAMALLHEQQLLVEQKKAEVQALRDALAREGARLAGGLNGSTTPPECASGRMSFTGSEAMGSQQASPVASLGPAASSAAACAAMAAPLPQMSPGFLAASEQAQAQSATTAAAAAAALAGSSTWPFTSAAGSSAAPVAVSQAPVHQPAADLDICDELDSLASVFDAELADAHHAALEPPTTQMALQQLQQQEELVTAAIASALAAHQRHAANVSPSASGALNAAASQLPTGLSLPGTCSTSQSLSWGAGMPMLQAQQGAPQDAQIQQLMQAVHSLHQSVQELSLRVGSSNSAPLVYPGTFVNNMQGL